MSCDLCGGSAASAYSNMTEVITRGFKTSESSGPETISQGDPTHWTFTWAAGHWDPFCYSDTCSVLVHPGPHTCDSSHNSSPCFQQAGAVCVSTYQRGKVTWVGLPTLIPSLAFLSCFISKSRWGTATHHARVEGSPVSISLGEKLSTKDKFSLFTAKRLCGWSYRMGYHPEIPTPGGLGMLAPAFIPSPRSQWG